MKLPATMLKSQAVYLCEPLDEVDRDNLRYGRITRQLMARAIAQVPHFDSKNWQDVMNLADVLNEYLEAGRALAEVEQ